MGNRKSRKWLVIVSVLAVAAGGLTWLKLQKPQTFERVISTVSGLWRDPTALPAGFAAGNGRIEAIQVDIATKLAGRVEAVLAREGEFVEPGQIVARMDTKTLQAERRQAQAEVQRAREELEVAKAVVAQRQSELNFALAQLERYEQLVTRGNVSKEQADEKRREVGVARATLNAARATVLQAKAAIESAAANVNRIESDLDDSVLKAARPGRVQYRLAEPGEVLAAGGNVYTTLDVTDVYMTMFLPETVAGKVPIGAAARILLDALPDVAIPAKVSFVAAEAQFTPKQVETRTEREKLMFRIKAQIDPDLLRQHAAMVKTGLPGVAYIRLDENADWPEWLPRAPDAKAR